MAALSPKHARQSEMRHIATWIAFQGGVELGDSFLRFACGGKSASQLAMGRHIVAGHRQRTLKNAKAGAPILYLPMSSNGAGQQHDHPNCANHRRSPPSQPDQSDLTPILAGYFRHKL